MCLTRFLIGSDLGKLLQYDPHGADDVASWRLKIHAKINQSIDREKGELTGTGEERRTGGAMEEQRQQASPEKKPDLPPQRENQKWGRKVRRGRYEGVYSTALAVEYTEKTMSFP
ncbi:hypothetical protein SLEP1_g26192 [Rubroshorea leprosula]|uniref:AP2/ERF domain-containing protein n=1 Tax=Rubroshorea leprosula TaxID=152421 RepID=A0AAV5JKY2_9ROSI|nr:hypothetical protein SLEP1_g26192 [Rubroshorea leprosula]